MRAYALTMYQSGMVGEVGCLSGLVILKRGHPLARSARASVGITYSG